MRRNMMNTGDVGRLRLGNGDPLKYVEALTELRRRGEYPDLERWFAYHAVTSQEAQTMAYFRTELLGIAQLGLGMSGLDQESYEMGEFLAKLQEAMFWFNAAIARRGR
jgi:hypothetical protein